MITLPIKKQWFDMIVSGVKKEEYRALTSHYKTMFANATKNGPVFQCRLRNGYMSYSPSVIITCICRIGRGRPEWGGDSETDCFVLSILSVNVEK